LCWGCGDSINSATISAFADATNPAFSARQYPGSTSNVLEVQKSDATKMFYINSLGNVFINDGVLPSGLNTTAASRRFNIFTEGSTSVIQLADYTDGGPSNGIAFFSGRGTKAAPTALQTTNQIAQFGFNGYDDVGPASAGSFVVSASGTWSNSGVNHPAGFDLTMVSPQSNTARSRLKYDWATETLTLMQNSSSNTGRVSIEDSVFMPSIIPFVSGTKLYLVANGANNNQILTQSGIPYADISGAPSALSLTTTGTSGAATYNSGTGVLNIPQYSAGGGGSSYSVNTITASTYTETATSGEVINLLDCTSNAIAIDLPTAVGNTAKITFKKIDNSANTPTVTPDGSETIDGEANQEILFQYTSFTIISDGANWYIIN
jgi:hypothetical protein